ncbi:MAG: tetratricopeptide repeat protein, partial [Bacteroidetes bacterium]|nr:tetratricopeptide repeat protein [Bacteroidota bacterium]
KKISSSFNNIGNIYNVQSNYPKALEYYQKSLRLNEKLGNKKGISECYNSIGAVLDEQGNLSQSLNYYEKSLKINQELGNKKQISGSYNNIGVIYNELKAYSKAMEYFLKSLQIYEELGDKKGISINYNNLGNIYKEQFLYTKALEYYQKSLNIYKELGDKEGISSVTNDIAGLYIILKDYKSAFEYAQKALTTSIEIGALERKQDAYYNLSTLFDATGDIKKALFYYKLYSETKDSILNTENQNRIIEMEAKYQSEKKEKEISLLNEQTKNQDLKIGQEKEKKQNQLIIFIASLIFIILFSVLLYSRYRHKQKNAMTIAMAEQQKLRFKEVIEAQELERKRIAEDLHDSIGLILATAKFNMTELEDIVTFKEAEDESILKNSIILVDEAFQEVRNISHNMMPSALTELGLVTALKELISKMNKSHKLHIDLKIYGFDERLNELVEITVYRIVQEIISNIIKHAEATVVDIILKKENTEINLNIEDNGIGIDKNKIEKSSGIGWKNIFSRVTMLNGKINIDSKHNLGTTINISFCENKKG